MLTLPFKEEEDNNLRVQLLFVAVSCTPKQPRTGERDNRQFTDGLQSVSIYEKSENP